MEKNRVLLSTSGTVFCPLNELDREHRKIERERKKMTRGRRNGLQRKKTCVCAIGGMRRKAWAEAEIQSDVVNDFRRLVKHKSQGRTRNKETANVNI
jgi:hypothetical protein